MFISGILSKILAGFVLVLGIATWFLWNKNQELAGLNAAFEVRNQEQIETINSLQQDFRLQTEALTNMQSRNIEIQEEMSRYLDIFSRHNLTKLAAARPGMIEPRINNATKEVFDGIEQDSRDISALASN